MQQETMKALVYFEPGKYGLADVPVPKIEEPTDIIGRVTLAAICTSDVHTVHGGFAQIKYPKSMGHEFCIEVVEVGSAVKNVKVGERYVSRAGSRCGECLMCKLEVTALCPQGGVFGGIGALEGAHAEYIRIPKADSPDTLWKIPDNLSEEDVLLVPDMLATAWYGLKNAELVPGQSVAVIGAGPVGLCTCLLAKKVFGARTVIATDTAQYRLDLALQEGIADIVINAKTENVVEQILAATGGLGVDATVETPGLEETMAQAIAATRPGGIISALAMFDQELVKLPLIIMIAKDQKLKMGIQKTEGVDEMIQMIADGKFDTKFMCTHKAPLNDIEQGYDVFGNQKDGCIKWLITPYEN